MFSRAWNEPKRVMMSNCARISPNAASMTGTTDAWFGSPNPRRTNVRVSSDDAGFPADQLDFTGVQIAGPMGADDAAG